MTITIPLSVVGSAESLSEAIESYRSALIRQMDEPGTDAPMAPDYVQRLVQRVPAEGPVEERGPDTFMVLPFVVIDDTAKPPEKAAQTLAEKRAAAVSESRILEITQLDEYMSPARRRLLDLQIGPAYAAPEVDRTDEQKKTIERYIALQAKTYEIQLAGINRELGIETMIDDGNTQ
jgi:hypothetical protein